MRLKNIATIVILNLVLGCATADDPADSQHSFDIEPFLELAGSMTDCADIRNDLYTIDDQYVLWVVEGNCADASYGYRLYGTTVDELLCIRHDSIAGPQGSCPDEHDELFSTLVANLDDPSLGLGGDHTVVQIK